MVLVTGGTGLVGSHLLYKLTLTNKPIRAIYRSEDSLKKVKHVFSYYSQDYETLFKKIEWFKTDLINIPELDIAFKNVTHVFHCAALISFNPKDYNKLHKTNVEGTANIVNLCISHTVKKLVYVSSIATLGSKLNDNSITEDNHWNDEDINSVYGITKYNAELEVWRATQEGLNAVIINPGVIIGPGFWDSGSGLLFKKVNKGLSYFTKGNISLVDVNDVADLLLLAMKSKVTEKRFIAVSENKSYREVLTQIAQSLNIKAPKKSISSLVLQVLWRLDWLKSFLFFKQRELTKVLANSLTSKKTYSNKVIKDTFDFQFTSVDESIKKTSALFLKDCR